MLAPEDKDAPENSNREAYRSQQPANFVEDVVRLTSEKPGQYEAYGWHIERKGKENIVIRDKAKSLLCYVLIFKVLVEAGLKFDASGYRALAWSMVSFGLTVNYHSIYQISDALPVDVFTLEAAR